MENFPEVLSATFFIPVIIAVISLVIAIIYLSNFWYPSLSYSNIKQIISAGFLLIISVIYLFVPDIVRIILGVLAALFGLALFGYNLVNAKKIGLGLQTISFMEWLLTILSFASGILLIVFRG